MIYAHPATPVINAMAQDSLAKPIVILAHIRFELIHRKIFNNFSRKLARVSACRVLPSISVRILQWLRQLNVLLVPLQLIQQQQSADYAMKDSRLTIWLQKMKLNMEFFHAKWLLMAFLLVFSMLLVHVHLMTHALYRCCLRTIVHEGFQGENIGDKKISCRAEQMKFPKMHHYPLSGFPRLCCVVWMTL